MRQVLSEGAERAVGEIHGAPSMLRSGMLIRVAKGRLGGRSSRLRSSRESFLISHLAFVAEEYVSGFFGDWTRPYVPPNPAFVQAMWQQTELGALSNWHQLLTAWYDLHGIGIEAMDEYKLFRGVVDARNAIVHGMGELTLRQIGKDHGNKTRIRLKSVGIETRANRLVLDTQALSSCTDASLEFIGAIDRAVTMAGAPI